MSLVSPHKGTTTDPVMKAMELLPLGPVMIIDTPGYDDEGDLGELRIRKMHQILSRIDIAVLVIDGLQGWNDNRMLQLIQEQEIPYLIVYNKSDLLCGMKQAELSPSGKASVPAALLVSAETGEGITELKERLGAIGASALHTKPLVSDLVSPGDTVVLVIPIDESAPKGRLILPQQQVLRELLEAGVISLVCRETELAQTLAAMKAPPALVITDSQVFAQVAEILPEETPLTSFSILMARYKGFLQTALDGIRAVEDLQDGDLVLIAEGCTHHRQCKDIGTIKIPGWIKAHTGKDITIKACSGREYPEDLSPYKLVIHCGGCMLNEREIQARKRSARSQGIPFINYGVLIAYINGILKRSIRPVGLSV